MSAPTTPPPDVETEGFDRSEKLLFLGGAILVVIIAAYGAYALLSAGSGKSSNVTAGASAITTTTRAANTTTTGNGDSTNTDVTVTTEATPDPTTDTTVPVTDTTTGGGGPTPTTTPPPVPTTLPPGVRPIVQVTPRSGDRLVIPNNTDVNNVNPGVTAGKISIVNAGSSPANYFVTVPTGNSAEVLKSLRIRIYSGGSGPLAGGGTATVVVMLQANPKNDQQTPVGEAQPGDTGQLIIRGLGPDIVVNYVVG